MRDQRVEALLIAAGGNRISKHWKDEVTAVEYTVTTDSANVISIGLAEDDPVATVVVLEREAVWVHLGTRMLKAVKEYVIDRETNRRLIRLSDSVVGKPVIE